MGGDKTIEPSAIGAEHVQVVDHMARPEPMEDLLECHYREAVGQEYAQQNGK
jgi:hypothetical protein